MKRILTILTIVIFAFACDKKDCPNEIGCVEPVAPTIECFNSLGLDTCTLSGTLTIHNGGIENDTANQVIRKIVIEEYTGFKCTNCPDGARKIAELMGVFGDTLIPISIHAGSFSVPAEEGGHSYVTDFRTDAGNEYNDFFLGAGAGYPNAVVARTKYDGSNYSPPINSWKTTVQDEIDASSSSSPPSIFLTSFFSVESRLVLVKANVTFKDATSNNHRIVFLCIEDDIVDVQLDGGTFVEDYIHKHVLRGSMDLTNGELINDNSVSAGDKFDAESSYFQLGDSWDSENIEIVALLINTDNAEIVQAEVVHIN